MADLLGSILGSMEKPPTISEGEKKKRKAYQEAIVKRDKLELAERRKHQLFVESKIASFFKDTNSKCYTFEPMDKSKRSVIHDVSETAGLIGYSFGVENVDRHTVVYKKQFAPCEEELACKRRGEVYKPKTLEELQEEKLSLEREILEAKEKSKAAPKGVHYQTKFAHLIGKESAVSAAQGLTANRQYGLVSSENKRDSRSIEETLNEIRAKKKRSAEDESN